jgi:hypothetical protein
MQLYIFVSTSDKTLNVIQLKRKKMNEIIIKRFNDLEKQMNDIRIDRAMSSYVNAEDWGAWSNAVINLFLISFGKDTNYYKNFCDLYNKFDNYVTQLEQAKGIFKSAKIDYENGFTISIEKQLAGEIYGDFVSLAKTALFEKQKEVAAVLACAALEDALKKYAVINALDVNEKSMAEVVNILKANSLVKGAQKTLLDTMPKIRNYAMHANWEKFNTEDVSSIIGFVEQFLLNNFS